MRTTYAYRAFKCECGVSSKKFVEIAPASTPEIKCGCGKSAVHEEMADSKEQNLFRPFWSDTMQKRIRDREDLKDLRSFAKRNGLTNVGHMNQKPDRKAIRHNYETD